jgi:hypothetical protein
MGMTMRTLTEIGDTLQGLVDALYAAGDDPGRVAAVVVQLRSLTTETSLDYLVGNPAVSPMLDRLRDLAQLRKAAESVRATAAAAVEAAQVRQEVAIATERKILDERTELVCGLSRLTPPVPITHIAATAELSRARVHRIVSETKSHPATCPCRS